MSANVSSRREKILQSQCKEQGTINTTHVHTENCPSPTRPRKALSAGVNSTDLMSLIFVRSHSGGTGSSTCALQYSTTRVSTFPLTLGTGTTSPGCAAG